MPFKKNKSPFHHHFSLDEKPPKMVNVPQVYLTHSLAFIYYTVIDLLYFREDQTTKFINTVYTKLEVLLCSNLPFYLIGPQDTRW